VSAIETDKLLLKANDKGGIKGMKKIIVEIEASDWTQENIDSLHDWLQDELQMGNMGTGDDAHVVSIKFAESL